MNQPKERILFLYLSTGGGHISAARALAQEIRRNYSDDEVEVFLYDGIPSNGSRFQRALVESGYRFTTSTIPFLWSVVYQISNIPFVMGWNTKAMTFFSTPHLRKFIREKGITRVVSLHFLMTRPLFRALRQTKRLDMPVVTVVTDPFTAHPMWFFRQFSPLVVFSDRAAKDARKYIRWLGWPHLLLPRKRDITKLPPILSPRYNSPMPEDMALELRKDYGFTTDRRLILIAGGGEGLPRGESYLEALASSDMDVEIAFVCGRNISQFERVQAIAVRHPGVHIKVYGFVDFMYELMSMADVIVTKAGPATIFEALLLQKPLILTQRLYGQEQGNVDFVVNNNLGWFISNPWKMVEQVRGVLEDPGRFDKIKENIRKAGIQNGTEAIARHIMSLPEKPEKRNKLMDLLYSSKKAIPRIPAG